MDVEEPLTGEDCEGRPIPRAPRPHVTLLDLPLGADVRDVLDRGVPGVVHRPDVVLTRDRDVIAYARERPDYLVAPLPWSSTYALAVADADAVSPVPSAVERDAFARDAVRTDARGAADPFRWQSDSACAVAVPRPSVQSRALVAYPSGDAVARQVAERVVALAGMASAPAWVPASLRARPGLRVAQAERDSLAQVLADGRAAAVVIEVRRDTRTGCGTANNGAVVRGAMPLVDVRTHAIVRRGSGAAFVVGSQGGAVFVRGPRP
jgi:hypothetical protein